MHLDDFRTRWIADRPTYVELAEAVVSLLSEELRRNGVLCDVSGRAKEIASLLTKVIRKGYTDYDKIGDKAGVRVIVWYPEDVAAIDEAVLRLFKVNEYEDKESLLAADQFGYAGKHYQVTIPEMTKCSRKCIGLGCEIQVHTRAQNLWSDVAHDLTYKPAQEPPRELLRNVNRLVALVELFDRELQIIQNDVRQLPNFQEAAMLYELEKAFYRFAARRCDKALSLLILATIKGAFSADELSQYPTLLHDFVAQNEEKLDEIFQTYANDERCSPLLFQPESIAIFERLESNPPQLREKWDLALPATYLDDLATIWGVASP